MLKIIRRGAAVGILAALLFGLLAGVMLPACAKAAQRAPAGTSLKAAKPTQTLTFPLAGSCWLSDAYGWREDPFTGDETFHRGVDLACAEGTPVLAALAGTVTAARRSTTYGNYLCLSHADGQETIYAHMQYLYVRAGEVVRAGSASAPPGRRAGRRGRTCTLNFWRRASGRTPPPPFLCHEADAPRRAVCVPGPGTALRRLVWAALVRRQWFSAHRAVGGVPPRMRACGGVSCLAP